MARAVKSPSRIKCGRPSETLRRSRIAYKQHLPVESQRPEITESNLFSVNALPLVDLHLIFEKPSRNVYVVVGISNSVLSILTANFPFRIEKKKFV